MLGLILILHYLKKNDLENLKSEKKKKNLRENLSYLSNNKLILLKTGVYTPETYLKEEERLKYELKEFKEEERQF